MVESDYNYYTSYEGNIICLNGVTGTVFALKKDEFDMMKKLMQNKELQEKLPELTNKLIKARFLITSIDDEKKYLKKLNKRVNNEGTWHLTLNPTQDCNFNCWYCYEKHPKGWMQPEIVERIKRLADHILEKGDTKKIVLSWFGGEPLLYFNEIIYPLSLYIKQCTKQQHVQFSNSITTNGFLLTKDMIEKCKNIGLKNFQITLDGNKESHDKIRHQKGRPSFDKIIENCIALCSNYSEAVINLRINYSTNNIQHNFSDVLSDIPEELRSRFYIQFQRIWQTYEKEGNDKRVKKILDENFFELKNKGFNLSINTNYNKFKGILCYADRINYANINYDGNIYKCTAQDYTPKTALGYLNENGDIIWNKEKTEGMNKYAFFENSACLNCKYLAVCGGPCFYTWWEFVRNKSNIECPKKKDKMDINLPLFIREYYLARLKRRSLCN